MAQKVARGGVFWTVEGVFWIVEGASIRMLAGNNFCFPNG
jgi:hypothetical protein